MAYLRFNTKEEAEFRNFTEARRRGYSLPDTVYYWRVADTEGCVLDVGDGYGLSEEELERLTNDLAD
jgi:hypothetical protein